MSSMNTQSKYKLEKEIGEGQFGKVYMGRDVLNNCKVAIKRINKKKVDYNEYLKSALMKEIEIMQNNLKEEFNMLSNERNAIQ